MVCSQPLLNILLQRPRDPDHFFCSPDGGPSGRTSYAQKTLKNRSRVPAHPSVPHFAESGLKFEAGTPTAGLQPLKSFEEIHGVVFP
jgi:hypothetical protein